MDSSKFIRVLKSKRLGLLVSSIVLAGYLNSTKVYAAPEVSRYSGTNRYETAAKVCNSGWTTDTENAVLVNGENYPDALSAAPLAKKLDAPILLTSTNELNPYSSAELTRLNVKNVYIIGGKGVVSQSIEDSLKNKGIKVTRIAGEDRYETALKVAAKIGKTDEIAVVNGNDFKDGMSIASIAALKGMPIILTDKDYMPASVQKYLKNSSKMTQVYVVGDENTISENVINGLSNVKRIGYGNAYSKNISIIEAFQNELNTDTVYVASAKDFPDSLGAAALAPRTSSPIIFVDSPIDNTTMNFLKKNIVHNLKILGGAGSISYVTEQSVKSLPLEVGSTNNITATIWQGEKYTPPSTMLVTATDGTKKEAYVDWNLTKINTTKPGIYTFKGELKGTDKTVYTTLTVKPLPYKIDDLKDTANSKENYELPTTVTAQMTDGSKSQVEVSWDYGTQSGNKPGIYTFYGTVNKYNKKVKLTLTISPKAYIASIKDFKKVFKTKKKMEDYIKSSLPKEATVTMDDGTTDTRDITWDSASKLVSGSAKGTYILKGTVEGYSAKVKYLMIVTEEGGVDPDPSNPGNGGDDGGNGDNGGDAITVTLAPIIQGEQYPSTVKDPTTKKDVKVTWTRTIDIDSTFVNKDNVDDCRISKVTLEGTIGSGNNTKVVRATVGIIPRIIGITTSSNTSNSPIPVVIPISGNGIYDMSKASKELRAIIIDPVTGNKIQKEVTVLLWDPPYVSVGESQNYKVRATINNYINSNNTNTIDVTLQVQR